MNFDHIFLLGVLVSVGTAAGVYAAIRADLATLHERAGAALASAARAHERIDVIVNK